MAIITEETPIGYALPPVSRKLNVELNQIKTNDGQLDTYTLMLRQPRAKD